MCLTEEWTKAFRFWVLFLDHQNVRLWKHTPVDWLIALGNSRDYYKVISQHSVFKPLLNSTQKNLVLVFSVQNWVRKVKIFFLPQCANQIQICCVNLATLSSVLPQQPIIIHWLQLVTDGETAAAAAILNNSSRLCLISSLTAETVTI